MIFEPLLDSSPPLSNAELIKKKLNAAKLLGFLFKTKNGEKSLAFG